MTRVAVLGAGSWGTAFSLVLADAGNDVTLWARREDVCGLVNEKRENTEYLPGVALPDAISATPDPDRTSSKATGTALSCPRTLAPYGSEHPPRHLSLPPSTAAG